MQKACRALALALAGAVALAQLACAPSADIDTSTHQDSGSVAGPDAGQHDAGASGGADGGHADAGTPDGGPAGPDAGAPFDAGNELDAGSEPDAGNELDAGGSEPDAGSESDAGEPDAGGVDGFDAGEGLDGGGVDGFDAGVGLDAGGSGGADAGTLDGGSADGGAPDGGSHGGSDGGSLDAGAPDAGSFDGGVLVRVMTGNLTSGNDQSYLQPGIDIFAGLHPDVALVQEFNVGGNSQAEIDAFVSEAFGDDVTYFRESGSAIQIPNGIVSRFPILDSGVFTDPSVNNRSFAWAKIQLPNGKILWAYSLHLLTTSATNRNDEAVALVADIQGQVPAGDYLTIGGDFNTGSRSEACVGTLAALTVTSGPYPVDNLGNADTSTNRNDPHDWVLASPELDDLEVPAVVGTSTFDDGLVVDTRVYTPLSDIAPAQEGDSGASGMQHMAVVRDFLIP